MMKDPEDESTPPQKRYQAPEVEFIPALQMLKVTQYVPLNEGAALGEGLVKQTAVAEFQAAQAAASKRRQEKDQADRRNQSRRLVRSASIEHKLRVNSGEDKIAVLTEIAHRVGWGRDVMGSAISRYRKQVLKRYRRFCAHIFNKSAALGYTTKDIAEASNLHPATVRKYRQEAANDNRRP